MSLQIQDIPELLKDIPAGEWVAISEKHSRILAHGPDGVAVARDSRTQLDEIPLIVRVPMPNHQWFAE